MIIGGGAVVPTLVLAVLLIYGLWMLPRLVASAPEGSLRIHVSGEQWWWRERYELPDGERIDLANEIRLPVNEPVQFILESSNVIHSFRIPSLGGKRDMIPGRVTRLALLPTRTGIFRGVCAEYCGTSHALMSFCVAVSGKGEFTRRLEEQRAEGQQPATEIARRGRDQFLANGCGACHTIRGTPARGVIGPNLTHVGSRLRLSAGILTNEPNAFRRWISHPGVIKPGAQMPSFGMLPDETQEALAAYLEILK
jgi:cytochrome c oxidase subunit 2